jgi:hypothetical protein|tara:strand:- start:678 stop:1238 length:561 start_codon:yes stop_codon:yes gene_type:complete
MEGLIQNRLISVADQIEFVFKKFTIRGMVGFGGHIYGTVITNPNGIVSQVLHNQSFPSLTSWSEACLREGLEEENMRYASWKRVIHTPSQRTLQSLRSEYNVCVKAAQSSRQDLFSEINRLHRLVREMTRTPLPQIDPVLLHQSQTTLRESTDKLLIDSAAIEFFRKWNGTCLGNTCLPQTGGDSE